MYKLEKLLIVLIGFTLKFNLQAGTVTSVPATVDSMNDVVTNSGGMVTFTASSTQGNVTYNQNFSSFNNATEAYSGTGNTAVVDVTFNDSATGNDNACTLFVNHSVSSLSGGGTQQCANNQSFTFNVIVPQVDINNVDIYNDQITVDVDPEDTPSSTSNSISFEGDSEKTFWSDDNDQISGGDDQTFGIDWTVFDQTPGAEYTGASEKFVWANGSASTNNSVSTVAIHTYGVFRISKYFMPDDSLWTSGSTTLVSMNSDGSGPSYYVHNGWITKVHIEGVGRYQGHSYKIKSTSTGSPQYYLIATEEGAWVQTLTVNHSLAIDQTESRLGEHDAIHLLSNTGTKFVVEDTGNWVEEGYGDYNQFDQFSGPMGPTTPDTDSPSSFVVKVLPGGD